MIALLDIFYEVIFVTLLYISVYFTWKVLLEKYSPIFKILFNVEIRRNYFENEISAKEKHEVYYFASSIMTSLMMMVNPILKCIVYFSYSFVHIREISSILFVIIWIKFLWYFDLIQHKSTFTCKSSELFLIFQIIYTMLNFNNTTTLIPILFQLFDEAFEIEWVFKNCASVNNHIINSDNRWTIMIMNIIVKFKKYRTFLLWGKMVVLSMLVLLSFFYSDLRLIGELFFYIYAIGRLVQIYLRIT